MQRHCGLVPWGSSCRARSLLPPSFISLFEEGEDQAPSQDQFDQEARRQKLPDETVAEGPLRSRRLRAPNGPQEMEAKSQGFAQCGRGPHGGYPNRRRILARLEQDEVSVLQQQRGVLIAEMRWSSTTVSLPQQELPQVYLATSSSPRVHFRQRGRRTFSCCARLCSTPASCQRPAFQHPRPPGHEPQSCRAH